MPRNNRLFILGLTAGVALIMPACGDDETPAGSTMTDTGTGSSGTSTTQATATSGTIPAGTSGSSTGNTDSNSTSGDDTAGSTGPDTTNTTASATDSATSGPTTDSEEDTGPDDSSTDTGTDPDPGVALVENLIGTMCKWGANCCTTGEFDFIFGPFTKDAEDCRERLVAQLHSNDNVSPSPSGKIDELLASLGYKVNLENSTPIPEGLQLCIRYWKMRTCNEESDDSEHCSAPKSDPCELNKLFAGKLEAGESCNRQLAGATTDIECSYGTSCENVLVRGRSQWICVEKGQLGDTCEPAGADHTGSCEHGLYCDADTARCAARPRQGETCTFVDPLEPEAGTERIPCEEHLSCDPQTLTCAPECSIGARCEPELPPVCRLGENCFEGSQAFGDGNGDEIVNLPRYRNWKTDDRESCPEGASCVPYVRADSDNTYFFCRAKQSAGSRCDSHDDCANGMHCNVDYTGKDPDPTEEESGRDIGNDPERPLGVCTVDKLLGQTGCRLDPRHGQLCMDGLYCNEPDWWDRTPGEGNGDEYSCQRTKKVGEPCENYTACNKNFATGCYPNGSDGAYGLGELEFVCQDRLLEKGDRCIPMNGLSDERFDHLPPEFSYWANYCKSGVCECDSGQCTLNIPPTGRGIEEGVFRCAYGANTGNVCDEKIDNSFRDTCRPGDQCVRAHCQPFLETGMACTPEDSNNFDPIDDQLCHWDVEKNEDGNRCINIWGSYYCGMNESDSGKNYCSG